MSAKSTNIYQNDYLSKPVRVEELQQKLDKWLKVKQRQAVPQTVEA